MSDLTEHTVRFCCPEHIYEEVMSLLDAGTERVYVWQRPEQVKGYERRIFSVSTEADPPDSQFRLFGCIHHEAAACYFSTTVSSFGG